MLLSDEILNKYQKLSKSNDTWGFTFSVYGAKTKFQISKINKSYILHLLQHHLQKDIWESTVLLGKIDTNDDLESMFNTITRGEILT